MNVDTEQRVIGFEEKPLSPMPQPGRPDTALASMGNYVFSADALVELLHENMDRQETKHDVGGDLIPMMVGKGDAHVYDFTTNVVPGQEAHAENLYWRDVGTIDAYFDSHMDLVNDFPAFDLYNAEWPIYTRDLTAPPAKIVNDGIHGFSEVNRSLLSNGVVISGAKVNNSVLSPNVRVAGSATITSCVLLDGVTIGEGAVVNGAVLDKNVHVPPGARIGVDAEQDHSRYDVSPGGVVVLGKGRTADL